MKEDKCLIKIIPNTDHNLFVFNQEWFYAAGKPNDIFDIAEPVIAFRIESKMWQSSKLQGDTITSKRTESVSFITAESGEIDPIECNVVKTGRWAMIESRSGMGGVDALFIELGGVALKNLDIHKEIKA